MIPLLQNHFLSLPSLLFVMNHSFVTESEEEKTQKKNQFRIEFSAGGEKLHWYMATVLNWSFINLFSKSEIKERNIDGEAIVDVYSSNTVLNCGDAVSVCKSTIGAMLIPAVISVLFNLSWFVGGCEISLRSPIIVPVAALRPSTIKRKINVSPLSKLRFLVVGFSQALKCKYVACR